MDKILITGGAGFIGTNLVNHLLGKYEIRVLDLFPENNEEYFRKLGVEILKGDIRDEKTAREAVKGCKYVVHLAAQTDVIKSVEDPKFDFENNAWGTLNMLNASKENSIEKFVFASSSAALGEKEPPIREDMVPKPISPYGASKLAGEGYCSTFYGSYGLKTVVLRFANVYGIHSTHKTSVIAKFIRRILEGKELVVYGDGTQTRDYINVKDICSAIELSLEKNVGGETFQIGTGKETSILQLIDILKSVSGKELNIRYEPPRKGEILRNYVDNSKAKRALGFNPNINLEQGVMKTFEWFKKQQL